MKYRFCVVIFSINNNALDKRGDSSQPISEKSYCQIYDIMLLVTGVANRLCVDGTYLHIVQLQNIGEIKYNNLLHRLLQL